MQFTLNVSTNRVMLYPKAFYFFVFAALASLAPFLSLYYKDIGLSGRQIGILAGMGPLVMLFSAPLFGAVADATRRHSLLVKLALVVTLVAVFWQSVVTSFVGLFIIVTIYALFFSPVIPLIDNSVLELLGEHKDQYGQQRLWGTIGWGVAAPLAGLLTERLGLQAAFYIFLIMMTLTLLTTLRLPISQSSIGEQFWRGLRLLVNDGRWFSFLIIAFTGGIGLSITHNYLFLHMDYLGASNSLMGLALAVGTLSELVVMLFSERILRYWRINSLLIFSIVALILRMFAYAYINLSWLVLIIQLFHGLTFGLLWLAGVAYANALAPRGLGATAQGLFAGVSMGLGAACGAFWGGVLYEAFGTALMFWWSGVTMLLGLLFFVIAERWHDRLGRATMKV